MTTYEEVLARHESTSGGSLDACVDDRVWLLAELRRAEGLLADMDYEVFTLRGQLAGLRSERAERLFALLESQLPAIAARSDAIALRLREVPPEKVADAIFGDERSPMQWHEDVVVDVVEALVGILTGSTASPAKVLPLDPHPIEDAGLRYNADDAETRAKRGELARERSRDAWADWTPADAAAEVAFASTPKPTLLDLGEAWRERCAREADAEVATGKHRWERARTEEHRAAALAFVEVGETIARRIRELR